MDRNGQIHLYVLSNCPICEELKGYLKELNVDYETEKMDTAKALTELRINNIFAMIAPVLQNGKKFMTISDLYSAEGKLRKTEIMWFLSNG
jgi:glutaredoxin